MTIDNAKELQMNIAKEGLALLVLHPTADVQLHRECISHIGTVWGIPVSDTQEVASLLEREQAAILAAGENGTVTHVLPEEELPMNASGLETLDNIWDLFCALPGFVDSKNEEKTERNAGYLVVSQSGGGMLRQGTRKGIRRTPANRGMRAHRVVKGLDISEDVCHGLCP